jgi:hypothetical protein
LHKQDATTIVFPRILEGVCVAANMLGHVEKLRYLDHDVTDKNKFPKFSKKVYLDTMGIGHFGEPITQPKQWEARLANTKILGLLEILHFGSGRDVNNCIKKLMAVTHEGYLWVEDLVSIDIEIITYITGLPSQGETLTQFLDEKMKEKELVDEMKNTYGTERGSCRIIIKCIIDATTRMATKIMA